MSEWEEPAATALDAQAWRIGVTLAELADVERLLEVRGHCGPLLIELRGLAAGLRSELASIESEARELRAGPIELAFPLAITTRTVRP